MRGMSESCRRFRSRRGRRHRTTVYLDAPLHRALRLKSAETDKYRIRQGHYRILYEIIDYEQIVTVVRIGDRREISRR